MDVIGVFVPAEDADRNDAVEAHLSQGREDLVPRDLAMTNFVVLMDGNVGPRGVNNVTVAVVGPVIESVGNMDLPELAGSRCSANHAPNISGAVGKMEGVGAAELVSF